MLGGYRCAIVSRLDFSGGFCESLIPYQGKFVSIKISTSQLIWKISFTPSGENNHVDEMTQLWDIDRLNLTDVSRVNCKRRRRRIDFSTWLDELLSQVNDSRAGARQTKHLPVTTTFPVIGLSGSLY